jgi:hypothetical protein
MKVLIGCENSGTVRDAFTRHGHDAMSCDLEDTKTPGKHYKGDLFDVIDYPWDLAIFHPPCTNLSVSGAAHFEAKQMDGRQQASVSFFMKIIYNSKHIRKTVIENPICIMSGLYRQPDQIIHPYHFGHTETKATCLWLKGVLPLVHTNNVGEEMMELPISERNRIHYMAPSEERGALRSVTYSGIAEAMAMQWGAKEQRDLFNDL